MQEDAASNLLFSTYSVLVGGVVRLHSKWRLVLWKRAFQKSAVSLSFVHYILCRFAMVCEDFVTSAMSFQLVADLYLWLVQWFIYPHAKSLLYFFLVFVSLFSYWKNTMTQVKQFTKVNLASLLLVMRTSWYLFFNLVNVFLKFSISL